MHGRLCNTRIRHLLGRCPCTLIGLLHSCLDYMADKKSNVNAAWLHELRKEEISAELHMYIITGRYVMVACQFRRSRDCWLIHDKLCCCLHRWTWIDWWCSWGTRFIVSCRLLAAICSHNVLIVMTRHGTSLFSLSQWLVTKSMHRCGSSSSYHDCHYHRQLAFAASSWLHSTLHEWLHNRRTAQLMMFRLMTSWSRSVALSCQHRSCYGRTRSFGVIEQNSSRQTSQRKI